MARRKNNNRGRRPRQRARASNTSGDALLSSSGELRTFHVSGGAVTGVKKLEVKASVFPQLKAELSGVAEWKLVNATFTWEPMVTPASDSGMVGLVALGSSMLLENLPTDVDSLLRAGMALKPASTRRSVQCSSSSLDHFQLPSTGMGGLYVHATKTGTAELGRVSGVLTIRVRGVGAA